MVSLRVHGTAEQVHPLFPPGITTVQDGADSRDGVRVLVQAERLEWVPAVPAGIDRRERSRQPATIARYWAWCPDPTGREQSGGGQDDAGAFCPGGRGLAGQRPGRLEHVR